MSEKFRTLILTNTLYGLIALIPVAIVVVSIVQLLKLLDQVAKPLTLDSRLSAAAVLVVGVVVLIVVSFVLGSIIQTRLGSITFDAIEKKLLKRLPFYEPIANILRGVAHNSAGYQPALITLYGPGTAVFGLLMEENDNDTVTVFVPSAPTMAVGLVHVVRRDRVTPLKASLADISGCLSEWGVGSRKLLSSS
jgi:uncharacterized membrane protein